MNNENRLNPDTILAHLQKEENRKKRGAFRIFFGMCPGVGKTYAMCAAAQEQHKLGKNIVVGCAVGHLYTLAEKKKTLELLNNSIHSGSPPRGANITSFTITV